MSPKAPTFVELLNAAQRSAIHLEMRDSYVDPDEAPRLSAWRAGHRHNPADRASWWRPWLDLVSEAVARDVVIRRARIVSEPVSEYTQYLHEGTFTNVAAGEQIRWLPRRQASDLALPGNDFWVFDDTVVRFGHFSGEGVYLGDEVTEDPAVAKLCTSAFEAVWSRAIPHDDYRI